MGWVQNDEVSLVRTSSYFNQILPEQTKNKILSLMLNHPYYSVSAMSQHTACVPCVILQGVFEHPSIADFFHKQCDLFQDYQRYRSHGNTR